MKRFSPKWNKGFMAFLAIAAVLALLITFFGRSPGYDADYGDTAYGRGAGVGSTQAMMGKSSANTGYPTAAEAPASAAPEAMPMPAPAPGDYADGGVGGTESDEAGTTKAVFGESAQALATDRKIINEGSAQIETKDFDKSIAAIDRMISQAGGFVESRNIQGNGINTSDLRYATITIRVPADKFNDIMNNMSSVGTVTQKNTKGTDITDQYIDQEARLKTLKVQEQTLMDIMAKAQKLEDVITLESRISDVQYEIESIQNQLNNYDRLLQYSRISININEVVAITEVKPIARTLGDKMTEAFKGAIQAFTGGLENFTLWLVANWILFAFFAVLILVFIIIRVLYKRKKHKEEKIQPEKKEDETGNA